MPDTRIAYLAELPSWLVHMLGNGVYMTKAATATITSGGNACTTYVDRPCTCACGEYWILLSRWKATDDLG